MIVEDLIRMGRPLLEGGMDAKEILKLISDVQNEKVKNFYRHVIVVEISDDTGLAAFYQVWGQEISEGKKSDFAPDRERAVGAPFVLPQGGNPIHPQGVYGVAAYPCYDRHMKAFRESSEGVFGFLKGRLEKTSSLILDDDLIKEVANSVHRTALKEIQTNEKTKLLGILILSDMRGEEAAYRYSENYSESHIGHSHLFPDKFIQPDHSRVLELFWEAKLQEGSEKGERKGVCTFCGKDAPLVTIYCKAWPWYLPTWTCPLPQGGNEKMMVEGIGSCTECYKALVYGACLFENFTRPVQALLTREIYSPVSNREGIRLTAHKSLSDFPTIRGSGLLLPILDRVFEDDEVREEFAENIEAMLKPPSRTGSMLDRHIDSVTGFECFLPEKVETDDYRLSLIYYSGDPGRGDIHLRAYIEDVIPSTVTGLQKVANHVSDMVIQLLQVFLPEASESQKAYYHTRYRSLPFMLARGYGGPYVWDQLQAALHRQSLGLRRPIRNVAERLRSITPRYPNSRNEIREEVIFYLTFLEFWTQYQLKLSKGEQNMAMRPWKVLLQIVFEHPVEQVQLESSAELGFACGAVMQQFSRQYYAVTKQDYLKQRVLTFGSDLTPEKVWRQGLKQIFEVVPRYEKLRLGEDFLQRLGVVLTEYDRLKQDTEKSKDEFMASFWAGHSLQGYDRPRGERQTETANQSEQNSKEI